jgi:predicted MFS family arabinose efflux permease
VRCSFILEGILTVIVGATLHWILPDSPETASFLQQYERDFLVRRLAQDAGTSAGKVNNNDKYSWSTIKAALTEWKIWFAIIIWLGNAVPVYGFTYTAPTIIRDLGYTSAVAQLLTVPVYTFGVISVVAFSWVADRKQVRWIFVVGPYSISAAGFLALLAIPHPRLPGLTYFFLFFVTAGLYPALISLLSWVGNNLAPSWKRAVGMALLISGGNLGGAVGSNIFLASQAPRYPLGYGMCLGMNLAAIAAAVVLRFAYTAINKRRDKKDPAATREKYSEEELLIMGDKSPLYRYVV